MKTIYDISFKEDGTVKLVTANVIEESIVPGAMRPTYKIRNEDGSTSRCGKGFMKETLELALEEATQDLQRCKENINKRYTQLKEDEKTYDAWVSALAKLV